MLSNLFCMCGVVGVGIYRFLLCWLMISVAIVCFTFEFWLCSCLPHFV